jgi:hypothetical protein
MNQTREGQPQFLAQINGEQVQKHFQQSKCEFGGINGTHLICILDGSDSFAARHGESRANRKERRFYSICRRTLLSHRAALNEPQLGGGANFETLEFNQWFRDAAISFFPGDSTIVSAIAAALAVQRFLGFWNEEHELGWEDQIHARFAVSSQSLESALALLSQSQRKELLIAETDWSALSANERTLIGAAIDARCGFSAPDWDALLQSGDSPDEGVTVPIDVVRVINEHVAEKAREADPTTPPVVENHGPGPAQSAISA